MVENDPRNSDRDPRPESRSAEAVVDHEMNIGTGYKLDSIPQTQEWRETVAMTRYEWTNVGVI